MSCQRTALQLSTDDTIVVVVLFPINSENINSENFSILPKLLTKVVSFLPPMLVESEPSTLDRLSAQTNGFRGVRGLVKAAH